MYMKIRDKERNKEGITDTMPLREMMVGQLKTFMVLYKSVRGAITLL